MSMVAPARVRATHQGFISTTVSTQLAPNSSMLPWMNPCAVSPSNIALAPAMSQKCQLAMRALHSCRPVTRGQT